MTKPPKRPAAQQQKIEEFARRRAGATYLDAAGAAQDRLYRLRDDFRNVPSSYRGYLAVGICSALESHIKYSYAAAAEQFFQHPKLLKKLFDGISVDIDALIATTSKTFHLADVVAANVSASTLAAYLERATHFFSILMEQPHDFPWGYLKIWEAGDPEGAKAAGFDVERLSRAFSARHRFVHETNVLDMNAASEISESDLLGATQDALFLISQFQRQFEHVMMRPTLATIRDDEGLNDAVTRTRSEIDAAFDAIRVDCDDGQLESLEKFKAAFLDYLWARSGFHASLFLPQLQYEAAASEFLSIVPEYRQTLVSIAQKQKYALSRWPLAKQRKDFGIDDLT